MSESEGSTKREITETNRRFEEATRKRDLDAMAAVYTSDAIVMPPDAPLVKGRDAIRELWGSVIDGMGLRDVKLETLDLELEGDVGCEVGKATLTLAPEGGGQATATAKFIVYWKKEGGAWKWHRDIWNAMPS